jgi:glutaredoxin
MMRRWQGTIVMLVCALLVGGTTAASGSVGAGVALFLFFVLLAAVVSPRAFPRSLTDAEAREQSAADGRPIVYWRPGCSYCMRMRAMLGREATRAYWVDIWSDPEGAATVRAATGGPETVPTVVFQGEATVNPDPLRVRQMLAA